MRVVDLCSGLGGSSQAFVDAGDEVIRVDIDRGFKPTIQADVQNLPIRSDFKPELVIFCPPCQTFSVSSIPFHWNLDGTPKLLGQRMIQLVKNGLAEIQRIKPDRWIMENPRGMLRTIIGKPRSTIRMSDYGGKAKKPTDLWGNVNLPMLPAMRSWIKAPRGSHRGTESQQTAAQRAKWPYGLSQAVRNSLLVRTETSGKQE